MAKTSLVKLVLVTISLVTLTAPSWCEVAVDLGASGSWAQNLFQDSNDVKDYYATANAGLRVYPLSILELSPRIDGTFYDKNTDLGNIGFGGSATLVPLGEGAPVSMIVSTGVDVRKYGDAFETVDNTRGDFRLALGYKLDEATRLRCGVVARLEDYPNFEEANRQSADVFVGSNLSFLGSNSFDLEAGYALGEATFQDTLFNNWLFGGTIESIFKDFTYDYADPFESEENLNYMYVSPRFSRPVGSRTGLNVVCTYRNLGDIDNRYVIGYSVETVSPWASLWEGWSISTSIKSYLVPNFVMTAGVGYWDKKFFKSLNVDDSLKWVRPDNNRKDEQYRAYLSIQRPIVTSGGASIQPAIRVEYTDNSSTDVTYGYSGATITLSFNASL